MRRSVVLIWARSDASWIAPDGDVRGQREKRRFIHETLVFFHGFEVLDLAPDPAPDVGHIGDRELRRMKLVVGGICASGSHNRRSDASVFAAGRRGHLTALARFVARHQGKELTDLRVHISLSDAQSRPRSFDVRVVMQGAIDKAVKRGRMEHLPPFGRKFAADIEVLSLTLSPNISWAGDRACNLPISGGSGGWKSGPTQA